MSVTRGYYYWIETAGSEWTEAVDLSAVEWAQPAIAGSGPPVVIPGELTVNVGITPSTLSARVVADANKGVNGVYDPAFPKEASGRSHTGEDTTVYLPPSGGGGLFCPFQLCRLQRADTSDEYSQENATTVFVGVVTSAEYSMDNDEWDLEITELARWHMSKIGIYGMHVRRVENADYKWIENALPVFNPEGKPNQLYSAAGEPEAFFVNPNYNSENGVQHDAAKVYAGWWRLGDVLNYLQAEYNAATGDGGILTENYLSWASCTDSNWEFLLEDSAANANKIKDLALGGMSLAQAIDAVVRKAGPYEWYCEWDYSLSKFVLKIYDARQGDGSGAVTYYRGRMGASVSEARPNVIGGSLKWNWEDSLTQIKPLGAKKRIQFTVDTNGNGLEPGWTAAAKTAYDGAGADDKASVKFLSVYQRYVFQKDINWATLFGTDAAPNTLHLDGPRPCLPSLLTSVFEQNGDGGSHAVKLRPLAWRYKKAAWEVAPETISVQFWADGSIRISGSKEGEADRWATDGKGTAYPVAVTIAVETDENLTTDTSPITDKPGDWPTLERVIDNADHVYEASRKCVLLTNSGAPVLDNPDGEDTFGPTAPAEIRNDKEHLEAEATRTLAAFARPRLEGTIEIDSHDWGLVPGKPIGAIEASGGLPTITINAPCAGITYEGLSAGEQRTNIHLGGDTA